jgi:hypothetical protein
VDPFPQTMTGLRNELLDAQSTLLKAAEAGERMNTRNGSLILA